DEASVTIWFIDGNTRAKPTPYITINTRLIQKTDIIYIIIWTKPIVIIPITTSETGRNLSYIRFKGVKKTIRATITYVLNIIPVVEESIPISSTFNGLPKARLPLLIIIANAASDA